MLVGSKITADFGNGDSLFTKDNKRYGRFFLISTAENLKKWQVTPESIERRLRTFIGRPYISEPGLAHFDTDTLPLDQVIKKQEDFRAGTIIDVVQKEGIAYAIVEFANTTLGKTTWEELQKGKAIYTSPAVAGFSNDSNGVRTFHDWFGLHLARVGQPAYGVFHASLKQTCEGPEGTCVKALIASASKIINSSDISTAETTSMSMQEGKMSTPHDDVCPEGPTGDECRARKAIQHDVANIQSEIASLKTLIKSAAEVCPEGEKKDAQGNCVKSDTAAAIGGCKEGQMKDDNGNCVDKQSASVLDQLKNLQTIVDSYEAKETASLIGEYVQLKETLGIQVPQEKRTAMASMPKESIRSLIAEVSEDVSQAVASNPTGYYKNTPERIIHMPRSASASMESKPTITKLSQIRSKVF